MLNELKEVSQRYLYGYQPYSTRELLTLADGGMIYIDIQGDLATNNPLVFIIPGLTSCSQTGMIKSMVNVLIDKNYIAVVINYRGQQGA